MTTRPKRQRTGNTRLYALVDGPQHGIGYSVLNQAKSIEETAAAALELLRHRGPRQTPQSADGKQVVSPLITSLSCPHLMLTPCFLCLYGVCPLPSAPLSSDQPDAVAAVSSHKILKFTESLAGGRAYRTAGGGVFIPPGRLSEEEVSALLGVISVPPPQKLQRNPPHSPAAAAAARLLQKIMAGQADMSGQQAQLSGQAQACMADEQPSDLSPGCTWSTKERRITYEEVNHGGRGGRAREERGGEGRGGERSGEERRGII